MLRSSHRFPRRSVRRVAIAIYAACLGMQGVSFSRGEDVAIVVEREVPVPMRDGTVLRANVFRPAGTGPYPVLVWRTPYGKSGKPDETLVQAGFIVVTQDARGRYSSEGTFESFVRTATRDGTDGYDTVEWAAKLPGSTGQVGLFGTSYPGFLAWRAAGTQPAALRAMAAFSIPASYLDLEGPGTLRPGRRLKWWHGTISPNLRRRGGSADGEPAEPPAAAWANGEGERLLSTLPWLSLPDDLFATEAEAVKAWLRQPWHDPWQLQRDAERTVVPNLNVCGWYDHCNGSIDLHTAITTKGGSLRAERQSRLIIGPWGHSGLGKRKQGEIDFGPHAEVNLTQLYIDWFRHWFRGEANGVERWAPVRVFVMGINTWRDLPDWPPRDGGTQTWFLHSGGSANTPRGDGRLQSQPAPSTARDQYTYDPGDPVPTLWTPALFTVPADQSPLQDRLDILVYQSEPLEQAVESIGYPEVVLEASSDRPDTDFFVRLIDVAPDGRAVDVTAGMIRVRYRGAQAVPTPSFLEPGAVTELHVRMRPTAHRFLAGHRIRLDVTSSDFPNYDRHHNTAADQNADAELVPARQSIHHGGEHPSRLILPVTAIQEKVR